MTRCKFLKTVLYPPNIKRQAIPVKKMGNIPIGASIVLTTILLLSNHVGNHLEDAKVHQKYLYEPYLKLP